MRFILALLPGIAVMSLAKPCSDRGTAMYLETRRRGAFFYLGFFFFFAGAALLLVGLWLASGTPN